MFIQLLRFKKTKPGFPGASPKAAHCPEGLFSPRAGELARRIRGVRSAVGRVLPSSFPDPFSSGRVFRAAVSMVTGDGIAGGSCPRCGQAVPRPASFALISAFTRSEAFLEQQGPRVMSGGGGVASGGGGLPLSSFGKG